MLRGRERLLEAEIPSAARALDDAEEALRLACDCGYAFAEWAALLRAGVNARMGQPRRTGGRDRSPSARRPVATRAVQPGNGVAKPR
ncbi:MAG: hypothetical protein ACT4QB_08850 [Gammaproteobacteria bacterium]